MSDLGLPLLADRLFFGLDPIDPGFGAIRFTVDNAPILDAHSACFEPGSTSLRNLTAVFVDGRVSG